MAYKAADRGHNRSEDGATEDPNHSLASVGGETEPGDCKTLFGFGGEHICSDELRCRLPAPMES